LRGIGRSPGTPITEKNTPPLIRSSAPQHQFRCTP
jgi:hypothetical protein